MGLDLSVDSDTEPLKRSEKEKAPVFAETSPITELVGAGGANQADEDTKLDENLEAELFGEISSSEQESTPAKGPREEAAEPPSDEKSFDALFSPDQSPAEH